MSVMGEWKVTEGSVQTMVESTTNNRIRLHNSGENEVEVEVQMHLSDRDKCERIALYPNCSLFTEGYLVRMHGVKGTSSGQYYRE